MLRGGGDAYLNSETGTGKTLAYLLPILGALELEPPATQAIVAAPTHELALQIHRQCCDLAQNAGMPVRALLLIGGTPLDRQVEKLKARPHVVVGTPGRLQELIQMGKLKTPAIRTLVLDEADRLLADEGVAQVQKIVRALPPNRQIVCVSATEQAESSQALAAITPELPMLRPGAAATVNADITHLYLFCQERDKPRVLRQLLRATDPERALVFTHQNTTAENVAAQLEHHGITAAALHGANDKFARKQAMDDFRSGAAQVLIASDVAARGLDLPGVTHIVNLDMPSESKAYLHRAGRTGRAGVPGVCITLVTERDARLVRRYERELGIGLQCVMLRAGQLHAAHDAKQHG